MDDVIKRARLSLTVHSGNLRLTKEIPSISGNEDYPSRHSVKLRYEIYTESHDSKVRFRIFSQLVLPKITE